MRAIRLLNLRRLREQPLRALLGIVAIAAGTALLVGVLIDQSSLKKSVDEFVGQRAGRARLEVAGPGGPAALDEHVLAKVRAVNGVATAAPIVQVVTIAEDAAGHERFIAVFGVDCSIEGVLGRFGCDQRFAGLANAFGVSTTLATSLGQDGVVRTDQGRLPIATGSPSGSSTRSTTATSPSSRSATRSTCSATRARSRRSSSSPSAARRSPRFAATFRRSSASRTECSIRARSAEPTSRQCS